MNESPIKSSKVSIDDVKPGMQLEDIFDNKGKLILSSLTISTHKQIEALRRQGVLFVYLKSSPQSISNATSPILSFDNNEDLIRDQAYFEELSKAKEVHRATLEVAKNTLRSVRFGKQIKMESIEIAAEEIVSSILRNPDALVSLAQIKGYDEYTYVHSVNVGILISSLVQSMGYSEDLILESCIGGLLHDIGKMRVPEHILNKPGKYTAEEFSIMKRHPENGLIILKNSKRISDFSKLVIIEHHERFKGQGYPKGINANIIHEIGCIAAVSDVYDAMTTDRVYHPAWTPQQALAMIYQGSDFEYSRRIVELFTRHLGIYPVGSFVRLVSGEMGIVLHVEKGRILAPDVLILFDKEGNRLSQPHEYRLSVLQKGEKGNKYKIEISLNPNDYNVITSDYIQINPLQ